MPGRPSLLLALCCAAALAGCGDDDSTPSDAGPAGDAGDAAAADAGPVEPASTDHCEYVDLPATAGAGGTVEAGSLEAGAAEVVLGMSVGSTLGAYTARADFMGSVPAVDRRFMELAGAFKPSVGIETLPRAKAVALSAGGETVVIVKADLALSDEWITFELEERLGEDLAGKVIFATSHSHSAWGHYGTNSALQVGIGRMRALARTGLLDDLEAVARAALDDMEPARIGIAHDGDFDPEDRVSRDRRGENDDLPNGADRKDHDLYVVRVEATDGTPIAMIPIFGVHGTTLDADNLLASTDTPGAIERALEESFDQRVIVMHLQGAAGDVSPAGSGGIDCGEAEHCYDFARAESVGRYARDAILAAWDDAADALTDTLEMEMVTRSVELGPDWRTFTVRDGALEYAPFDGTREADGEIFDADGEILSPIDEFNAPVGAAFCGEEEDAIFPMGQLPGTRGVYPYNSCVSADIATETLAALIVLPFEDMPVCGLTRTTVSALRLGDHLVSVVPGEPITLFADYIRELSPVDPERTIVVGYAQGHVGYVLRPEDWLRGGYEPTITFWGPLQGEYLAERLDEVMDLAVSTEREDAAEGGTDRYDAPPPDDSDVPEPDAAPLAGTVPDTVPETVYVRGGEPVTSAQPPATVERLDLARFVWIGEDPLGATPQVTVERETSPGSWNPLSRNSGRVVVDGDILVTHTPDPLRRDGDADRTHYWTVEWQAVRPTGADPVDDLGARPNVPLGSYRFHVEGDGYTLDSEPFEVVPATLQITDAAVGGTAVTATASYHSPNGWRLLTLDGDSNTPVPVTGSVTVELDLSGGSTLTFDSVTPDDAGGVSVDAGGDAGDVTTVRVIDRFDNAGERSL